MKAGMEMETDSEGEASEFGLFKRERERGGDRVVGGSKFLRRRWGRQRWGEDPCVANNAALHSNFFLLMRRRPPSSPSLAREKRSGIQTIFRAALKV